MYGWLDRYIVLSAGQLVEIPAQVCQGSLRPILIIYKLYLQIDGSPAVQQYIDIQHKNLAVEIFGEGFAQHDGIPDFHAFHFVWSQMQQRTDQAFQNIHIFLQQSLEHVIIG